MQEFLDDPSLRTTTDRILARSRIIPRVGRGHQGLGRRGAFGEARRAQYLLLADQPARGPVQRSACVAAGRPRQQCQRRWRAVPRAGVADRMERRQYRRGAEGGAARRRHRGDPCRTRSKKPTEKAEETRMTDVQKIYPDGRVTLREVGLRDGLQLVKTFPSTQAKQRWVRDEYAAGVRLLRGRFVPAGKNLSAIRRRARCRRDRGLAAGRAWHCAGAERARRQRGAGIRRRRNRLRRLGDRRAQPGQCQPLARIRRSPMSSGCAICATPARTSRSCMPRSRWRWAARSRARSIRMR